MAENFKLMKKTLFLITTLFLINKLSSGQANLVINPSFENVTDNDACNHFISGSYSECVALWAVCSPWTIPDRMPLSIRVGTPDFMCGVGVARTGINYGRCISEEGNIKEYILQNIANLTLNNAYYIEFYVKGSGNYSNAGVYISPLKPRQSSFDFIPVSATIPIPSNTSLTLDIWTKVSGTFIAWNTDVWITFGDFDGNAGNINLLVDDFKIIDLGLTAGEMLCPEQLLIENFTYDDMTLKFQASGVLKAGFDAGVPNKSGDVLVKSNSDITYKAGTEVALLPGFGVEPNGEFAAFIAPCNEDCFAPTAFAGNNTTVCYQNCIELGSSPLFGFTYSWSSNPIGAISYLSNTNTANPTFCPPTFGEGTITYTVTTSNACGESNSAEVIINYDTNPNNFPSFLLSNILYSDVISFDINMNAHTEDIKIELYDNNTNTLINTYNLKRGVDFT